MRWKVLFERLGNQLLMYGKESQILVGRNFLILQKQFVFLEKAQLFNDFMH